MQPLRYKELFYCWYFCLFYCTEKYSVSTLRFLQHFTVNSSCAQGSAELGTQQFCRNNVTMLSGHTVVCNCNFTIFIVATPSRHWGLTIYRFFSVPWLVPEAILRCREAKKVSRAQLCCTLTLQYVREVLADMIMTNAKEDSPCWRPLCHRAID